MVKKNKFKGPEDAKYFLPIERGIITLSFFMEMEEGSQSLHFALVRLSHYHRENLIYKSRAVNFLFFDHCTVLPTLYTTADSF